MGSVHQPFLYASEKFDSRFPESTFDPKAVTRQSWEQKPPKPKQNGPLLSFNRHPDAHEVPAHRRAHRPMGRRTKGWIKGMRVVQLGLRVLQLNGAIGILILMILISNVDQLTAWVMRITAIAVMLHCAYGIYHLHRPAGARTPGSSAAYQIFSAFSDLCVLPLYGYGMLAVRNNSTSWSTLLDDKGVVDVFIPAVYYTLIGAGGLHLLSLTIALWLGLKFRQITLMPPDMNPLEDHLTSRAFHKRNKSSVATGSALSVNEKRLSTPLESRRHSGDPYEDMRRPPTVPFAHTRTGSATSLRTRDSRLDLPSRQYQITPGNSPRNSATPSELSAMKHMSAPPPPRHSMQNRGSYTEIPLHETNSRASTGTVASQISIQPASPGATQQPRSAKFSEAWYTSDSLINRTQERNRAMNTLMANATGKRRNYEAVNQMRDNLDSDSDSEIEGNENYDTYRSPAASARGDGTHPNPLRSNPMAENAPPRATTPFRYPRPETPNGALGEVNLNDRRVSGGSGDIADAKQAPPKRDMSRAVRDLSKRMTWGGGMRNSSIQAESEFYSKPYGALKPATPPIMQTVGGSGRQVSSGNDYADLGVSGGFGRRNVSGKIAEEGMAGGGGERRYSRYATLNED